MMNIFTAATLFCLLTPALCHAQNDDLRKRLFVGASFGASIPSGSTGTASGDPINLFDRAALRGVVALSCGYLLTPDLELGLTIEIPMEDATETASRIQRERIEAMYPGYLVEWRELFSQPALFLPSLGISYRFRFGNISVEPGLFASYGVVEPSILSAHLKKTGTNEYLGITHNSTGGGALALVPALAVRQTFTEGDYRYGLYLRATSFNTSFDTPYTISEGGPDGPSRTTSLTTHHPLRAVHVALGIHVSSF